MKALLLIEDDDKARELGAWLKPLGYESVRYRSALKALDNLEEINPEAIVASAADFPRHWKVIVSVVRASRSRHECVIVLLKGDAFDIGDADKATHLGVNGMISERLSDPAEQTRFFKLLQRYSIVEDIRESERHPASDWDRFTFLCMNPETGRIMGGKVLTVSTGGISIHPAEGSSFTDLRIGTILSDCSLRVGERIIDLNCELLRSGPTVGFSIQAMAGSAREHLDEYLSSGIQREIDAASRGILIIPEL
ncbi:MAG: hypothetical protein ACOYM2_11900 [Rectinemataceae bacterium]